jgi:hypothetical protein
MGKIIAIVLVFLFICMLVGFFTEDDSSYYDDEEYTDSGGFYSGNAKDDFIKHEIVDYYSESD